MVGNKLSTVRAVLRKARQLKDPLNELVSAVRPCCVNGHGHAHQFRSHHASDLPKEQLEWCLDVCRENMAALYERVWSWSDVKKRRQLTSSASRFLMAYDVNAARAPVGYINFRFEYEDGEAVLYCYELQVARAAQQRGLGRAMMELLEQIAWGAGMSKVMLTVFTENVPALAFYSKLGYRLDETSPDYSPASGNCSPLELARSAGGSGGSSRCSPELGATAAVAAATGGSRDRSASVSPQAGGSAAVSSSMADSSGSGSAGGPGGGEGGGSGYHILSKRVPSGWREEVRRQQEAQQQREAQLAELQLQAPVQVPAPAQQAQEELLLREQEQPQQQPPLQQAAAAVEAAAAAASPAAVRADDADEAEEPGSRKKQRTHDTPDVAGAGRSASCGPEQEGSAAVVAQHDAAAHAGHDVSRNATPAPMAALACAGTGAAAVVGFSIEQEQTGQVEAGDAEPTAAQPAQEEGAAGGGMATCGACSGGVAAVERVPVQ